MSLFNVSQNISDMPINMLVRQLPQEVDWVIGDSCIWITEIKKLQTTEGQNTQIYKQRFQQVYDRFPDIKPVMENFSDYFNNIMIKDNGKTIPEQCGDVMNSYLPKNSTLKITPTKYFIAFNNELFEFFKGIYSGYCLRHRIGQKGYEIPPEDIGYLHVVFTNDSCYFNRLDTDIKIHWFYPFAVVKKDK